MYEVSQQFVCLYYMVLVVLMFLLGSHIHVCYSVYIVHMLMLVVGMYVAYIRR